LVLGLLTAPVLCSVVSYLISSRTIQLDPHATAIPRLVARFPCFSFLGQTPPSIAYTYCTLKYPAPPDETRRDGLPASGRRHTLLYIHLSRVSGLNRISDPPFFWFLASCVALNLFINYVYVLCLLFSSALFIIFFFLGWWFCFSFFAASLLFVSQVPVPSPRRTLRAFNLVRFRGLSQCNLLSLSTNTEHGVEYLG
jgi:hypothetical protein